MLEMNLPTAEFALRAMKRSGVGSEKLYRSRGGSFAFGKKGAAIDNFLAYSDTIRYTMLR